MNNASNYVHNIHGGQHSIEGTILSLNDGRETAVV